MQIRGVYKNTVYRNADTGYTVFTLKLNEGITGYQKCQITCVGQIEASYIALPLLLTGEIKENRGEKSFYFSHAVPFSASEDDILDYPAFKNVSKETVKKLISLLGPNMFEWDSVPDIYLKLTSVDKIGPKKAQIILDSISAHRKRKEIINYIKQFGETPVFADTLLAKSAEELLNDIKKHPYHFGKQLKLSFVCCDAIAKDNGFNANSKERIRAIITEVLTMAQNAGHTCFPLERVMPGVSWLSKHMSSFPDENISEYLLLAELTNSEFTVPYVNKNGNTEFYLKYAYDNEALVADNAKRLQMYSKKHEINIPDIIRKCERKLNIEYNDIQKQCFNFLKSEGIKIITGGPGTGKTTVINGIIYAYKLAFPRKTIALMAPTGRAAQKISEVTGEEAGTLHRTLGINVRKGCEPGSNYNANFPADVIIIDETSMLDNEIAAQALSSFKSGSTVIMVGDINQLPSVGAGNILHDLINSGIAETAHLSVNYRQGSLSPIALNAEKIKQGQLDLQSDSSFHMIQCSNEDEMLSYTKRTFQKLFDIENPFSTQVLCAVKQGPAGVFLYNNELQTLCNSNETLLTAGKYNFKKQDKIMVIQNNYDDMCYNGDIGHVVKSETDASLVLSMDGREIVYPREKLNEIHLAYAMSIHKSQGSEYDNVIICLPDENSNMLKRRLIYTAVTRARKNVYIFYIGHALEKAITSNNDAQRITELEERLSA